MTAADGGSPSDLELVRLAQAGDSAAFGELVSRNRRAVFRAAFAALGSAAEADDVAQDAFVTAYQKLDTFRGDAAFRTWLLSITWRKAIDRRKGLMRWLRMTAAGRHGADDNLDNPIDRMASNERSQEDTVTADELQRQVRTLVAALPKKLRDTLLLANSGDYSYEQVGAMLKIPVGTVKWRVSEARRVLKKQLTAMGYTHG